MNKIRVEFEKKLEEQIVNLINHNRFSNIIFLCIGTSKIIGDAIGPMVGSNIKSLENEYVHIYGTVENNLNFNNAKKIIEDINSNYINPCIITIDAALSNNNNSGDIVLGKGFMKIGKALEKSLCFYSDINIKCVVGKYSYNKNRNFDILQKVRMEEITRISNILSNGIRNVLKKVCIYV